MATTTITKQYFEDLVLNNPVAIVTLDTRHDIVSCNPAFEQLYGYRQDEVIGRNLDELISTATSRSEAVAITQHVLQEGAVRGADPTWPARALGSEVDQRWTVMARARAIELPSEAHRHFHR